MLGWAKRPLNERSSSHIRLADRELDCGGLRSRVSGQEASFTPRELHQNCCVRVVTTGGRDLAGDNPPVIHDVNRILEEAGGRVAALEPEEAPPPDDEEADNPEDKPVNLETIAAGFAGGDFKELLSTFPEDLFVAGLWLVCCARCCQPLPPSPARPPGPAGGLAG